MDGASLLGTCKGFGSRAKKMVSLGVNKVSCSHNLTTNPRKIRPGNSCNNILHTTQASTHKSPFISVSTTSVESTLSYQCLRLAASDVPPYTSV